MSTPPPDMTLVSDVWVMQFPPASPPVPNLGPFADQNTAVSAGLAQLNSDATWTAFGILRIWRLEAAAIA
jgi:hypothetical protein